MKLITNSANMSPIYCLDIFFVHSVNIGGKWKLFSEIYLPFLSVGNLHSSGKLACKSINYYKFLKHLAYWNAGMLISFVGCFVLLALVFFTKWCFLFGPFSKRYLFCSGSNNFAPLEGHLLNKDFCRDTRVFFCVNLLIINSNVVNHMCFWWRSNCGIE